MTDAPTSRRAGRVEGKVAIVTGAGSTPGPGIGTGKATAVMLAREGASVVLVDVHPERADATQALIEAEAGSCVVVAADVTTSAGCAEMVQRAIAAFGGVDILVNNIGVGSFGDVTECTEEEWDRTLDVNLRTTFLACKHVVPLMSAAGAGSIVNVASIAGYRGVGHPAYAASKGGVIALTLDMAYSHGRQGIRVNALAPGHINTPLMQSTMEPGPASDLANRLRVESSVLGAEGGGWDVASAAVFLASDEARWITGVVLPIDGGTTTVTPLMLAPALRGVTAPSG